MQIISRFDNPFLEKINNFKQSLARQPIILLVRPSENVYLEENSRKKFEEEIKEITSKGLLNLEIPWESRESWLDLMTGLKSKFPHINLGSASVKNKKSIDDSKKVGLNFSMMKFWQKDLFIYSKKNEYLLIPGLNQLNQIEEAYSYNCRIIKIYPVNSKDNSLNTSDFKNISFIAAGGICISDLNKFIKLDYQGIVIGKRGYDGQIFDEKITKWLKCNASNEKN